MKPVLLALVASVLGVFGAALLLETSSMVYAEDPPVCDKFHASGSVGSCYSESFKRCEGLDFFVCTENNPSKRKDVKQDFPTSCLPNGADDPPRTNCNMQSSKCHRETLCKWDGFGCVVSEDGAGEWEYRDKRQTKTCAEPKGGN